MTLQKSDIVKFIEQTSKRLNKIEKAIEVLKEAISELIIFDEDEDEETELEDED